MIVAYMMKDDNVCIGVQRLMSLRTLTCKQVMIIVTRMLFWDWHCHFICIHISPGIHQIGVPLWFINWFLLVSECTYMGIGAPCHDCQFIEMQDKEIK